MKIFMISVGSNIRYQVLIGRKAQVHRIVKIVVFYVRPSTSRSQATLFCLFEVDSTTANSGDFFSAADLTIQNMKTTK